MEKEYQKIGNIFKFDEKFRTIVGLNEPYETLKNIIWQGTEKLFTAGAGSSNSLSSTAGGNDL